VNFGAGYQPALSLAGLPVASVAELELVWPADSLASVSERRSPSKCSLACTTDGWDDNGQMAYRPLQPNEYMAPVMSYMGRTGLDAQKRRRDPGSAVGGYQSTVTYPNTPIGGSLKAIAQGEDGEPGTRVFYAARWLRHPSEQVKIQGQHSGTASRRRSARSLSICARTMLLTMCDADLSEFGRRGHRQWQGTDHAPAGCRC